jgi:hypothetical protein
MAIFLISTFMKRVCLEGSIDSSAGGRITVMAIIRPVVYAAGLFVLV